jgi:ribonuclease HI
MSDADTPREDGPGAGGLIANPAAAYVVYTDGSCKPNPGAGGWAYVLTHGDDTQEDSGVDGIEQDTVSPRMEVLAVVRALEATPPGSAVVVRTDSDYLHKGITAYIKTWLDNGWKASGGKPVKHQDLWRTLWTLTHERTVTWDWLPAHTAVGRGGDPLNHRAHALAYAAMERAAEGRSQATQEG